MNRLAQLSPSTQLCAVIGHPLEHTLSPAIHNAGYAEAGLDFIYLAFDVERAERAVAAMRALPSFKGMSVTIPHKVAVLDLVDEVSEIDRRIGAINSVVKEDGRLVGFGSDGPGALKALRDAGVEPAGKSALILGAGGAARAIAFTLLHQARIARLEVVELVESVLDRLCDDLRAATAVPVSGAPAAPKRLAEAIERADIVINCTPVGMHPRAEHSPIPTELLRSGQVVFDIVYNPLKTKLLGEAEFQGCTVVTGAGMFVNQAVLQFERFCGCAAPRKVMERVVMERLGA